MCMICYWYQAMAMETITMSCCRRTMKHSSCRCETLAEVQRKDCRGSGKIAGKLLMFQRSADFYQLSILASPKRIGSTRWQFE